MEKKNNAKERNGSDGLLEKHMTQEGCIRTESINFSLFLCLYTYLSICQTRKYGTEHLPMNQ